MARILRLYANLPFSRDSTIQYTSHPELRAPKKNVRGLVVSLLYNKLRRGVFMPIHLHTNRRARTYQTDIAASTRW